MTSWVVKEPLLKAARTRDEFNENPCMFFLDNYSFRPEMSTGMARGSLLLVAVPFPLAVFVDDLLEEDRYLQSGGSAFPFVYV